MGTRDFRLNFPKIRTPRDENRSKKFIISWGIVRKAQSTKPGQKTCGLCYSKKLAIIQELRIMEYSLITVRNLKNYSHAVIINA